MPIETNAREPNAMPRSLPNSNFHITGGERISAIIKFGGNRDFGYSLSVQVNSVVVSIALANVRFAISYQFALKLIDSISLRRQTLGRLY
jgi:hypothetical protein